MGKKNKYKNDAPKDDKNASQQQQGQQSNPGTQQPSNQQQQGARGGGQPAQQGARGGGQPAQQGAWGGGQSAQQSAWGGGQSAQQSAWSGGPRKEAHQQSGMESNQRNVGGDPQRGGQQHSNQNQQKSRPSQQQGQTVQQQPRARETGGQQQAGGWVSKEQRQSSDSRHRGDGQQRGPDQQQSGSWNQQQRDIRQGDTGQRSGSNQGAGKQYGRDQQQKFQSSGGQYQQARGQSQLPQQTGQSNTEIPLPVKEKSCNGIVRGTLGKPGTVEVNYLRLNFDKMPDKAYHYDITINPDKPKKFLRKAFEQFCLEEFPNKLLTFDGLKNCYSIERLKTPAERTLQVQDSNNRMKEFQVCIKETDNCVVELKALRTYQNERVFDKPMRALQVLEVVLASSNHERGVRVGRSFFRRPVDAFYLEDGYEAWTGLYQAAILGEIPLLNVDIAHKSFPCESTLLEYLDNMRADKNQDLSTGRSYRDICSYLNGLNIVYTPPQSFGAAPKRYKVLGVGDPAAKKTFKTDDGIVHTVAAYFRSRGYALKFPNLNCLTVGSTVKQISLPMELCSIPSGQPLNRKDEKRQVEKMIRFAATSTNVRKKKIMDLLTYFDHNLNPIIRGFGLSVGSNFIKVPMRLLPSPSLEYLRGQTVTTFKGAWRMDNNKFLICSNQPNGHRWAIIYEESSGRFGINYHEIEAFKNDVIKTSQGLNMNLQNSADIKTYRFQQLQGILKQFALDKYDLVFVVLSERGTAYSKIKQTAELEVGILTQCIKDATIKRTSRDRSVFSNILLKVNGKLNGTNHKIAQDRDSNMLAPIKNVMFLGADVTHPSPDQRHIPSVVGVAASHDINGACYNCQYRLQPSTVENIEDMESIAVRHLQVYRQYQKCYPALIIYYRDGVSDGQFPIVEKNEISAIKRACSKLGCKPNITCVIVVKRHHTRFFPLTQPQHDRDFNNVQAGTVVDQHITHPNEVQFFMVSHQSIQGTARPTRYNVILDESKFDINLLQKLTYNLCHLFPRCNRAVSYPAPAYLAHLVAYRGRVYIEGTHNFDKNLKREYDRRQIKPDFINRNPMYFI